MLVKFYKDKTMEMTMVLALQHLRKLEDVNLRNKQNFNFQLLVKTSQF